MFGEDFLFRTADEVNVKIRLLDPETRKVLAAALAADPERDSKLYAEARKSLDTGALVDSVPMSRKPLRFTVDKSESQPWHYLHLESPRAGGAICFRVFAPITKSKDTPRWAHMKGVVDRVWLEKGSLPETRKRLEDGTYSVAYATDRGAELVFQSSGGYYTGRFSLAKSAEDEQWYLKRVKGEGAAEIAYFDMVRRLAKDGAKSAILPLDPGDPGRGYKFVDVEKLDRSVKSPRFVSKSDDQRYTLGVVYAADELDAHGDYSTAEELEKAAWKFYKVAKVGLMHADGTTGAGQVVESYIYRGPDWEFQDQQVKAGDWLLGVVWSPEAWAAIKSGEIRGYSLQGIAMKEDPA